MKKVSLVLIGLSSMVSFSAFADTPKVTDDSSIGLQVEVNSKKSPYYFESKTKPSENDTGLNLTNGSSSVQLYGTVDVGYEHWSKR